MGSEKWGPAELESDHRISPKGGAQSRENREQKKGNGARGWRVGGQCPVGTELQVYRTRAVVGTGVAWANDSEPG